MQTARGWKSSLKVPVRCYIFISPGSLVTDIAELHSFANSQRYNVKKEEKKKICRWLSAVRECLGFGLVTGVYLCYYYFFFSKKKNASQTKMIVLWTLLIFDPALSWTARTVRSPWDWLQYSVVIILYWRNVLCIKCNKFCPIK